MVPSSSFWTKALRWALGDPVCIPYLSPIGAWPIWMLVACCIKPILPEWADKKEEKKIKLLAEGTIDPLRFPITSSAINSHGQLRITLGREPRRGGKGRGRRLCAGYRSAERGEAQPNRKWLCCSPSHLKCGALGQVLKLHAISVKRNLLTALCFSLPTLTQPIPGRINKWIKCGVISAEKYWGLGREREEEASDKLQMLPRSVSDRPSLFHICRQRLSGCY